ncbi:hypothetical protein T484DRAFT_1758248 [Baffinella frigidus]|nr:hypothetical protein T484DRAFT_1758248 [Cryptophyta sp. CCMP2293]
MNMSISEDYIRTTQIVIAKEQQAFNAEALSNLLENENTVVVIHRDKSYQLSDTDQMSWVRETYDFKMVDFGKWKYTWGNMYNFCLEIHPVEVEDVQYVVFGMAHTIGMKNDLKIIKEMIKNKLAGIDLHQQGIDGADEMYTDGIRLEFATKWTIPNPETLNRILADKNTIVVMRNFLAVIGDRWVEQAYQLLHVDACHYRSKIWPNLRNLHIDMVKVDGVEFLVIAATNDHDDDTLETKDDHHLLKNIISNSKYFHKILLDDAPCFEEREEYKRMTTIAFAKEIEIPDFKTLTTMLWNRYTVIVMPDVTEEWAKQIYGDHAHSDDSDDDVYHGNHDDESDDDLRHLSHTNTYANNYNGNNLIVDTWDGRMEVSMKNVEVNHRMYLVIAAVRMVDGRVSPGLFHHLELLKQMISEELKYPKDILQAVHATGDSDFRRQWSKNLRKFGTCYGNSDNYKKHKWEFEYPT